MISTMKKQLFSILLSSIFICVNAQSSVLTAAYRAYKTGDLKQAKTLIEEAKNHPKTIKKSKTWKYRGDIYYKIATSDSSAIKALEFNALSESFKSYKKALEISPNSIYMNEINQNYRSMQNFALNEGINQFNCELNSKNYAKFTSKPLQSLKKIGFEKTNLIEIKLPIGPEGGLTLIKDFKTRIENYNLQRDCPGTKCVSYLSVHNRFGTISIRHLAKIALDHKSEGSKTWLNELIWRDFYFQILSNFPYIQEGKAFKLKYNDIQFENNEKKFQAWMNGNTGFPIVDAGMRQLNTTGYMHNRLRMIIACFLVKDLLIDWRWGEKYFADNLIDFDFSANNGGWQWAASTGCDAQPYFRVFNPTLQSEKFDPEGKFIKKYVPELKLLNKKQIHQPFTLFSKSPNNFPIKIGEDYPIPIVNHAEQKTKAIALFKDLK